MSEPAKPVPARAALRLLPSDPAVEVARARFVARAERQAAVRAARKVRVTRRAA